jgi:DNA-binding response OmpR family regulator
LKDHKIKIFLAEDDDDDRDFFNAALDSIASDVELITVNNGEQAINFFKMRKPLPDLVFLDINMPKADGIECLKYIKQLHPSDELPVIMLSTASSEKVIALSHQHGASIYIEKPSQFRHLITFIDYCINDLKNAPEDAEFVLNRRLKNL